MENQTNFWSIDLYSRSIIDANAFNGGLHGVLVFTDPNVLAYASYEGLALTRDSGRVSPFAVGIMSANAVSRWNV